MWSSAADGHFSAPVTLSLCTHPICNETRHLATIPSEQIPHCRDGYRPCPLHSAYLPAECIHRPFQVLLLAMSLYFGEENRWVAYKRVGYTRFCFSHSSFLIGNQWKILIDDFEELLLIFCISCSRSAIRANATPFHDPSHYTYSSGNHNTEREWFLSLPKPCTTRGMAGLIFSINKARLFSLTIQLCSAGTPVSALLC